MDTSEVIVYSLLIIAIYKLLDKLISIAFKPTKRVEKYKENYQSDRELSEILKGEVWK